MVGILVPAGLGWDFGNFYDAGHRVAAGQAGDIYHSDRPIAGQRPQGAMRFWGAPLSAAFFAPLSWMRPELALVVFKVENVLALAIALLLLYRHGSSIASRDPATSASFAALFATMTLLFQPFWTVFRVGGQSTATVLLIIVIAFGFYVRARFLPAGLLLGTAAMIKPTLAPMLIFLGVVSGWPFFAALVASAVILGGASIAVLGWSIHAEFLRIAIEGSQIARPWQFNSSMYVPIENLRLLAFGEPGDATVARALLILLWGLRLSIVALFVVIVRTSRRAEWRPPARRHFEFLMAVSFWLLVSFTIWEHYLGLLFIMLTCVAGARHRLPTGMVRLAAAIVVASLGQNLVLMEAIWTRVDIRSLVPLVAIGLAKSAPLLLTAVLIWFYREAIFQSYATAQPLTPSGGES
jgi:hypothetical protein